MCQHTFLEQYIPGKKVSIDEAMVKYKGRVFFRQYMPKKPIKWGIKVWILAEQRVIMGRHHGHWQEGWAVQLLVYRRVHGECGDTTCLHVRLFESLCRYLHINGLTSMTHNNSQLGMTVHVNGAVLMGWRLLDHFVPIVALTAAAKVRKWSVCFITYRLGLRSLLGDSGVVGGE